MKYTLVAVVVLALLVTSVFLEPAMASDTLGRLTGTWVEVDPKRKDLPLDSRYTILIDGDKITISWPGKVLCDTIFRLEFRSDGVVELKNTKKRENWKKYAKPHQYEEFGHFKKIEITDSTLVGFIFVADRGYLKIPFEKHP